MQRVHVRICGGPGWATTQVYPARVSQTPGFPHRSIAMSIRTDIIDVLKVTQLPAHQLHAGNGCASLAEYATIAQCVVNGHIQVVQSSVIPSTMAVYRRRYYFAVGSSPSRNLIVHEATHALNDWHKRTITDVDDEGVRTLPKWSSPSSRTRIFGMRCRIAPRSGWPRGFLRPSGSACRRKSTSVTARPSRWPGFSPLNCWPAARCR